MNRVAEARALPGFRLWVRFSDGLAGEIDLSDLVGQGVFAAWNESSAFERAYVDTASGTVAWPGGIDLCPDSLYDDLVELSQNACAPA
jgi:hypothetical protein